MRTLIFLLLASTSLPANAFFFPEIPFCPFGGPPGWFNRITNDDYYRYPPPVSRNYYPASNYPVYQPPRMMPPLRQPCGQGMSGHCPPG